MDELTWEKSWGSGSGYGVCRMSVPWLVILILGGLGSEELVVARHIWRYRGGRSGVDSTVTLATEIAIDGPSEELPGSIAILYSNNAIIYNSISRTLSNFRNQISNNIQLHSDLSNYEE